MNKSDSSHFHALIMAGGKGERFWPWSREKRPKQLLPLFGKKTMVEMTVDRLLPLIPRERIWILTNPQQARSMQKLMPRFPRTNFIIEPVGRDSAGAVMLGCAQVSVRDPKAVMALLPADALIKNQKEYLRVLHSCFEAAQKEKIFVTIGIRPKYPSSAYGYIERGEERKSLSASRTSIFKAKRFLEKPDSKTAERLVKTRRFYWNAGMFIWSADAIHEGFKKYSPIHARGWKEIQKDSSHYLKNGFLSLPKISIDYAIMEKAKNVYVADGTFDWDDVGSWSAMAEHMSLNRFGNIEQGEVIAVDSKDCLIFGNQKMIATLGVQNLVIVQTEDAILICDRKQTARLKEVVKLLPGKLR
jgi:mannose-1-phosphate guanylyltransferase